MKEKGIFSNKLLASVNKVPTSIFIIVGYFMFVFSQLYFNVINSQYYADVLIKQYAQVNVTLNPVLLQTFYVLLSSILTYIIFEIVVTIFHTVSKNTMLLLINNKDFKSRARLIFLICNLIIGLLQIPYFYTIQINGTLIGSPNLFDGTKYYLEQYLNPYSIIQSSILDYVVYIIGINLFYLEVSNKMPVKNKSKLFISLNTTFLVYLLVELIIGLINMFVNNNTKPTIYHIIAICLMSGVIFIYILYILLMGLKINNKNKNNDDDGNFSNNNDNKEEKKPDYIFEEYKL